MNDYFLKILMRERQHQLLMEARGTCLRPVRRSAPLWRWKAALVTLVQAHLFHGCFPGGKGRVR